MSAQLLAGHTQTFYYTYLLLGLYWVVNLIQNCLATRKFKPNLKMSFHFPLTTLVAILLSMIQLLPTIKLTHLSIRSENYDPRMIAASLHPLHLFTFLIPYLFEKPGGDNVFWGITQAKFWSESFYVGIFILMLCLLAVMIFFNNKTQKKLNIPLSDTNAISKFRFLIMFFFSVLILLIVLSSGIYTPIYNIFYCYLPFFNKFRWPSRIMEMGVFSLAIIAGIGTHYFFSIVQNCKNTNQKNNYLHLLLKIVIILDIILIIGFLCGYFIPEKIIPLITEYINFRHFESMPISLETRYYQMLKEYMYMLIILNACILLFFLGIFRINYRALNVLISLIIIADLFIMFKELNHYSNENIYKEKTDVIKFLESDKDLFRVATKYSNAQQFLYGFKNDSVFSWAKFALIGETSLPFHIFKLVGGGELKINHYMEFWKYLINNFSTLPKYLSSNILNLLNVKYTIDGGNTESILFHNGSKKLTVTEHNNYLPRIFVVGKASILSGKKDIFSKLFNENFEPSREIIIEAQENYIDKPSSKEINYKIKNLEYTSNKITLDIELNNNGFLVLGDTYYPGWKAYIGGRETKIYKTNYIMRPIFIKNGDHKVEFIYNPSSFKIGYITTLSTVFILIVLGILQVYAK